MLITQHPGAISRLSFQYSKYGKATSGPIGKNFSEKGDKQKLDVKYMTAERELVLPDVLVTIDFVNFPPEIARHPGVYVKVLASYVRQYSHFVDTAVQLITDEDLVALRELVHSIKGASGSLGMMNVHEQAAKVENAIRQNQRPEPEDFDVLFALVEASINDAEHIVSLNDTGAPKEARDSLALVNSELTRRLKEGELISGELIEAFRRAATDILPAGTISEVCALLDDYDYDEALERLLECNAA